MLVVLIGLDRNTSERRIALDVVGFSQKSVSGRKSALEELFQVDLAAGRCKSQEIKVVDMNVSFPVCSGMIGMEHKHLIKLLCAFGTVFQHGPHGGISVDIGVFPFDIVILSLFEGQVLIDLHEAGVHFPDPRTLRPVKDIFLRRSGMTVFDEYFFHCILDLFYSWTVGQTVVEDILLHFLRKIEGHVMIFTAQNLCRLVYRVGDLVDVKFCTTSVSFNDLFDCVQCYVPPLCN